MYRTTGKLTRAVLVTAVLGAASLAVGGTAGAAPVSFPQVSCNAHLSVPNIDTAVPIDFTFEAQAPASAAPGTPVTVTIPADTSDLPATNSGQTVTQYANIGVDYGVTGGTIDAASVAAAGDTTINGAVTPAVASATADTLTTTVPGPIPPGTLATPAISFNVVGTTAGTNVVISVKSQQTTATLDNAALGDAAVTCPINGTLATTEIVAAGAPTAADDKAETQPGQAVTIDVRANDTASAELAIDETKFAITTAPTKGTATIVDGKIVYTPNAGVEGTTDTLVYTLCSVPAADGTVPCDTATVTITIAAVQAAAPAAAAELPRTGSDTTALALGALAFVVLGLMLARQSKTAVRRP
ncbi:MAG TPA: Ig-like domain-containing protein [Acidimicrobiia bacterium]|nr:Ig-like domain-containing protein [Acidimicrobiia bacterium]